MSANNTSDILDLDLTDADQIDYSDSGYGVLENGDFRHKHIDQVLFSMETELEKRVPQFAGAPGDPLQQLLEVVAIELEDLWETQRATFYAAFFEDSFGLHLDRLVSLAGVGRLLRRGATGEVRFGTPQPNDRDYPIASGTVVTTKRSGTTPPIPFRTTERAVLKGGETAVRRVPIEAVPAYDTTIDDEYLGADTNVHVETITQFQTTVPGVRTVTNPLPTGAEGYRPNGEPYRFRRGRDRESDPDLKERYRDSLGIGGKATLTALKANVFAVEGVRNVAVDENVYLTDNRGDGGLSPKSVGITALADPGLADDIAQAIVDTRSAGIESWGEYQGTAEVYGQAFTERFDLAGQTTIAVRAALEVDDTFPTNGEQLITDNIISYLGGTLTSGQPAVGTEIGKDVSHALVENACIIDGVWDLTVQIGTEDIVAGEANVEIAANQVAQTSINDIDIDVTRIDIP